jgi:Dcp1-like decapping family
MDEEAKRAFNMKVLKRHDASITKILASASFVVLYSHNEQWVRRAAQMKGESMNRVLTDPLCGHCTD